MHAVYRSRFQHDKNRIQVFMLLHAFGNHIYKLIGAWLALLALSAVTYVSFAGALSTNITLPWFSGRSW